MLPWARRQLALTLVDVDPQANRAQALAMLRPEEDLSVAERAANARARNFVRASDPALRASILATLEAQSADLEPAEHFRLAGLAEADGDSMRARTQAQAAWDADPGNPEYLAFLIRNLLRTNQRAEAKRLLALLVEREGHSVRCREFAVALEKP